MNALKRFPVSATMFMISIFVFIDILLLVLEYSEWRLPSTRTKASNEMKYDLDTHLMCGFSEHKKCAKKEWDLTC